MPPWQRYWATFLVAWAIVLGFWGWLMFRHPHVFTDLMELRYGLG